MDPRIQYATAADGVSIAYWSLGEGMPAVHMPPIPWSHIELEWQDPDYRAWYERLARGLRIIRYDSRGSGLSQRQVTDCSLRALAMDVEAVVDRAQVDKFVLVGVSVSGPVAIAFAALHPERVSHLVLWCTYASSSDVEAQFGPMRSLFADWDLFTETAAHALVAGWSAGERARRFAALMRASTSRETLEAITREPLDASGLLAKVRAPTLILHRRDASFPSIQIVRELVPRIPDARLVILEGQSLLPFGGDMEQVVRTIEEFLGVDVGAAAEPVAAGGGLATILFTDVQGSTALTQRLGDARAREALREHERIVRETLRAHGGSEVKTTGDGFMASFSSATRALECAIALQRAFAERNRSAEEPIRVRIGLNAGEPIAEGEDLFGTAVNLAARIAGQAAGDEVLVSDVVRQLVAGKGFLFSDRGETALRGFEDPVRLYEVRWRDGP